MGQNHFSQVEIDELLDQVEGSLYYHNKLDNLRKFRKIYWIVTLLIGIPSIFAVYYNILIVTFSLREGFACVCTIFLVLAYVLTVIVIGKRACAEGFPPRRIVQTVLSTLIPAAIIAIVTITIICILGVLIIVVLFRSLRIHR